jgi:hypothetical protein
MATRSEKAFCVLECARTQSIVTVQRRFRTKFGKDPPVKNSKKQWYKNSNVKGTCVSQNAISRIDREMLRWVWAEMDYRIDVYRVTKGGHTEHL